MEENLARYICSILQDNQQNSEYIVQDVQYIRAQVKIVKCTVNDILVDISFNQMAGLSALCFLEKVLHKFSDYYSAFDWANYCITITGPVSISSLPAFFAGTLVTNGDELLPSRNFLSYCRETYFVPMQSRASRAGHPIPSSHVRLVCSCTLSRVGFLC